MEISPLVLSLSPPSPKSTLWPRKVTFPQPPCPWLCPLVPSSPGYSFYLAVSRSLPWHSVGIRSWLFPVYSAEGSFFCSPLAPASPQTLSQLSLQGPQCPPRR